MKLSAISLTLKDVKRLIEEEVERETGEDPDNITIRLTLPDYLIDDFKEGRDTVDLEVREKADEAFLLTWESKEGN